MKEHHSNDNKEINVNKSGKETRYECELYKCKTNKNDDDDENNNNETCLSESTSTHDYTSNNLKKTFCNNYVCIQTDKSAQSTLFRPANKINPNNNKSTHNEKYCNKESCSLQEFVKNVKIYCKWWNIDRMAENYLHALRHTLQEAENALVEKTLCQENIARDEVNTRKQEQFQETSRSVHVHTHNVISEGSALQAILQLRLHAAQERSTKALLENERLERELKTYRTVVEEQNKMLQIFHNEQEQQQQHEEDEHTEVQHLKRKQEKSREVKDEELISAKIRAQLARARQLRVEQLQCFYPVTLCNASTHENTLSTSKKSTKTLINGTSKISNLDKCDSNGQQTELRENTEFIAQWPLPYFNLSICTLPSKHFGNLNKYNNKYTNTKDSNRLGNDTKHNNIGSKYNNRVASDLTLNNNTTWKAFTSLKASESSTTSANEGNNGINNNLCYTNSTSLSSPSSSTHSMTRQVQTPWVISQTVVRDDVDGEGNALVCAGRVLRTLAEVYSISLPHPIILSGVHSYVCSLYPSRSVDNNRWQSSSASSTSFPCTTQNAMLQKCKMYTDKIQPQESCQMQTWYKWPFFVKKSAQRSTLVQHAVELLIMDAAEIAHAMGKYERLIIRSHCSLGVVLHILLSDN